MYLRLIRFGVKQTEISIERLREARTLSSVCDEVCDCEYLSVSIIAEKIFRVCETKEDKTELVRKFHHYTVVL